MFNSYQRAIGHPLEPGACVNNLVVCLNLFRLPLHAHIPLTTIITRNKPFTYLFTSKFPYLFVTVHCIVPRSSHTCGHGLYKVNA
jgi:hypothetical protein